jgi:hypothetical protein
MPELKDVDCLALDFHGVMERGYGEAYLAYCLFNSNWGKGNHGKAARILLSSPHMLIGGLKRRNLPDLEKFYVQNILEGESAEELVLFMGRIGANGNSMRGVPRFLNERTSPSIIQDSIDVARELKGRGKYTGIYSNGIQQLIAWRMKALGYHPLFGFIEGNPLIFDSCGNVTGIDAKNRKEDLNSYLRKKEIAPERTVYVDNAEIEPLMDVGYGVASPDSEEDFKNACSRAGVFVPETWRDVRLYLGLEKTRYVKV